MVKSLHSSKNSKKHSKTDEKPIHNLERKIGVKKSPEKLHIKIKQKNNVEKKGLEKPKVDTSVETQKKILLSKKANILTASAVDKSPLKKVITKKSSEKPKTLEQSSNTSLLKKATASNPDARHSHSQRETLRSETKQDEVKRSNTDVVPDNRHHEAKRSNVEDKSQAKSEATISAVLKKEEPPSKIYTSAEKRTKTPISLEALNYVRHFLESSLSEECVNFLYNLKLDFIYEDSCLKADYASGLACKFLYILQSKGIAEYIKKERTEEKARFDFLWIIKSEEILRQARMFYADRLREIDEILDIMTLQEVYIDPVSRKFYTFDEAVERNFISEKGVELKLCDSNELLIEKHKFEKIINSLTDVQMTSLHPD